MHLPMSVRSIPEDGPSGIAEEAHFDPSSTIDFPYRTENVLELIREAIQPDSAPNAQSPSSQAPRQQPQMPQEGQGGGSRPVLIQAPEQPQPRIFWPDVISSKFLEVARNNRDATGLLVETIAFVCGYQDTMGNRHATHLIFPAQKGELDRVIDRGINGRDTVEMAMQQLSTEIEGEGRQFCLISWVHSHVRGYPICLSSIDLHMQLGRNYISLLHFQFTSQQALNYDR